MRRWLSGLTYVLVALFALGDGVLVWLALGTHNSTASALSTSTVAPPAQLTPAATPTTPPALTLIAASYDGRTIWRAQAGCAVTPHFAVSTDGGHTWHAMPSPPHLLRLVMTATTSGWAIAADDHCTPSYEDTSDATHWSAGSLTGAWFVAAGQVHRPTGAVVRPCTADNASSIGATSTTTAIVRCGNTLQRTADGGRTWTSVATHLRGRPVAVALARTGVGIAAYAKAPGCSGLQLDRTSDAGATWSAGTCVPSVRQPAAVIVTTAGIDLLITTDQALASRDGGRHWQ